MTTLSVFGYKPCQISLSGSVNLDFDVLLVDYILCVWKAVFIHVVFVFQVIPVERMWMNVPQSHASLGWAAKTHWAHSPVAPVQRVTLGTGRVAVGPTLPLSLSVSLPPSVSFSTPILSPPTLILLSICFY